MAKPEWGTKRVCQSCGARFYDLARSPIVCPSCGAVFDLEVLNRTRRARPTPRAAASVVADEELAGEDTEINGGDADLDDVEDETEVEEDDAAIEADDGQEEDDSLIEDASELGEDEDVSDVIEGGLDEEEQR